MYDTCRLRKGLHAKDSPKIDLRVGILTFGWIATQDKQIIAEDTDKCARSQLRGQAFHLDGGRISLRVDHLK